MGLTIGEIAKAGGVHVETIRYYERRKLLPEPSRRPSGYREYDPESVSRIRFIKNAQALGFSLDEIDKLLALRVDADSNCDQVRQEAEAKVEEVAGKIQRLQQLHRALLELIMACERGDSQSACPLLDALESQTRAQEDTTDGEL